ncbi:MAG TPA: hypothetical protein VHB48_04680 [Chitinophagaceae bacterium]|jgi:hypothetical protein|nr:hypothetical protein [Chitinophagaceae bacterium]
MPVKFKLYQACAYYLLLWATCFIIWAIYQTLRYGSGGNPVIIVLVFLTLAGVIAKAVLSIKAIKYYKQLTAPGRAEKTAFITAYGFIILLAAGLLLLIIFVIIPDDFINRHDTTLLPAGDVVIMDTSIMLANAAAIYFTITDPALLKAIRLRQYKNLFSFELDSPNP